MKSKHSFLIASITTASIVAPASSWSATIVERNEMRGTQEIIMEEYRARINSPIPEHYMLMDIEKEKVYLIDTQKKRLVEMDINGTPPKIPQDMLPPSRERRNGMPQDGRQGGPYPDGRQGGQYPDGRQDRWQGAPPQDRWQGGPPNGRQDRWQGGPPQYGRQGGISKQ